jgi:hypothetical protein
MYASCAARQSTISIVTKPVYPDSQINEAVTDVTLLVPLKLKDCNWISFGAEVLLNLALSLSTAVALQHWTLSVSAVSSQHLRSHQLQCTC